MARATIFCSPGGTTCAKRTRTRLGLPPRHGACLGATARALCDPHTGAGADGWMLIAGGREGADGCIQLWNSDGSTSEISGNGTRCAAAFLIDAGRASEQVSIATGAGVKHLRLLERHGLKFSLE